MQGLDLVSFAACGQGHGERGCRRCPLPTRRDVTTTCTADNRETNSTAPEYSVLAAHHPGACCPEGVSQVRACAKVLSAPRLRVRFRHGIRQRQGASALVLRHPSDGPGGRSGGRPLGVASPIRCRGRRFDGQRRPTEARGRDTQNQYPPCDSTWGGACPTMDSGIFAAAPRAVMWPSASPSVSYWPPSWIWKSSRVRPPSVLILPP